MDLFGPNGFPPGSIGGKLALWVCDERCGLGFGVGVSAAGDTGRRHGWHVIFSF
jgi:hypothetical protein